MMIGEMMMTKKVVDIPYSAILTDKQTGEVVARMKVYSMNVKPDDREIEIEVSDFEDLFDDEEDDMDYDWDDTHPCGCCTCCGCMCWYYEEEGDE